MHKILFCILFALSFNASFSQNIIRCGTDEKSIQAYPDYQKFLKELDKSFEKFNQQSNNIKSILPILTIPVHVIIVHAPGEAIGSGSNLSVARIQSQIDVLNEDFRRLNGDSGNTPPVFPAGDSEIEFCLAIVDPNGNPTDGITRYATTQNMNSSENAIKAATRWDRNDYLNIWSAPNLGSILGWAYLPSTTSLPNATLDGVVVATGSFGGPGQATNAPYHLGRTATHEVGHYLGLQHIWRNNGCNADDGIADTPIQDDENYGCPSHPSPSCSNGGDMFMNYMDYVNDNCMNAFTVGQGNYMRNILNTSRSSLLASAAIVCSASGPALAITVTSIEEVSCFGGADGQVEVSGSGGTAPYMYSLNNGSQQSNNIFLNLTQGNYIVTVHDSNGNTASSSFTINAPEEILVEVSSITNNPCYGFNDGSAFINVSGGTPPYAIDNVPISGNVFAFTNLAAGNYFYTLTDLFNCSKIFAFTIEEPLPIVFGVLQNNDVSCFGGTNGSFSYIINGGTPSYTFSLDNVIINQNPVNNLPSGLYEVLISDNNGCLYESEINIDEPELLSSEIITIQNELCEGASNGIAEISALGGTGPYLFSVDNAPLTSNNYFDDLASGDHLLQIYDANNCQFQTVFNIEAGGQINSEVTNVINNICGQTNQGSFAITGLDGDAPFTYTIASLGLTNTNGIFSNLPAGNFIIDIVDNNGCSAIDIVSILDEGSLILEISSVENVICANGNNGSIAVNVQNQLGNASYSINGIDFQSSPFFENLPAGDYTIQAIDESGCATQMNVSITEPLPISMIVESTAPLCFNEKGSASILASGGNGSVYTFQLDELTSNDGIFDNLLPGDYQVLATDQFGCGGFISFSIINPEPLIITEILTDSTDCYGTESGTVAVLYENAQGQITQEILDSDNNSYDPNMLNAGTYSFVISDENGCMTAQDFEILDAIPMDYVVLNRTNANCDGTIRGTISFEGMHGIPPYTYKVGQKTNMTGLFDNFNAGTYELTMIDALGCEIILDFDIFKTNGFDFEIVSKNDITCYGDNNGRVELKAEDSTGFIYRLNGEENTDGIFENLPPGFYTYEIDDDMNCTVTDTFTIHEPIELQLAVEDIQTNGAGLSDITLFGSGGTPDYNFKIDNESFQSSNVFLNVDDGVHTFTIIDKNACEIEIIETLVGFSKTNNFDLLTLYPNPAKNEFNINFESRSNYILNVEIIESDGKLVDAINLDSFQNKLKIDISTMSSGLYLVKIQLSNGQLIFKKMIVH